MRGDSVRDLYAKTMALLGLGVLAGAGALVDYWPVGVTFPQAGVALEAPSVAAVFPAPAPGQPVSQKFIAAVPPSKARLVQISDVAGTVESLPISETLRVDVGQQVALAQPMAFAPATPEMTDEFPSPIAADYQSVALTSDRTPFDVDATLAPVDTDSDGLITGAFKKAGSSIVRTSVRTGASIYDAARVIGGAMRKALPN